jgi:flagellar biosynthetic protein FliO
MTARLLTLLALALPLTACAAQPGQASGSSAVAATAAGQETRAADDASAAAATAAPTARTASAAPAHQAGQQGAVSSAPAATHPRAVAGTGAPSAAPQPSAVQSNTATPLPAAVQPDTAAAPASPAAPAVAAPDVAAPRPATPGVATPGVATPGVAVPPVTMPSGSSTGSLLQTLFALILVLAVLGALAWFLKRYGPKVGGGNANLRVVGSLNLGGRERIMVVEVGNEWIVVGASPGRINALATMPRQDGQNGDTGSANATLARHATEAPAAHSFADWLKQTIDKRK